MFTLLIVLPYQRIFAFVFSLVALCPLLRAATPADFAGRWQWTMTFTHSEMDYVLDVTVSGSAMSGTLLEIDGSHTITDFTISDDDLKFTTSNPSYSELWTINLSTGRVKREIPGTLPDIGLGSLATHNGQPVQSNTIADFVGRWQWSRTTATNQSVAVTVDVSPLSFAVYNDGATPMVFSDVTIAYDGLIFNVSEDGETHTLVIYHSTNTVEDWRGGTTGAGTPSAYPVTWSPTPTQVPTGSGSSGTATLKVNVRTPSYDRLNTFPGDPINLSAGTTGTANHNIADLGQDVTFNATASAVGSTLTWQWSKDGQPLPGVTGSVFSLSDAQPSAAGTYGCTVTDGQATATWATQLEVGNPPVILSHSETVPAKAGDAMHLTVRASAASTPIRFQWVHNGSDIPGATSGSLAADGSGAAVDASSNLDINTAGVADAGSYYCNVTCYGGTTQSTTTSFSFVAEIVRTLKATTLKDGESLQLTVEAKSIGGYMTFQWLHNGVAIPGANDGSVGSLVVNGGFVVGDSTPHDLTSTYTVSAAHALDAGSYACRITTQNGTIETDAVEVELISNAHLVNLSTRVLAGGNAGTPTCGFVVDGAESLPVLVRGVGPTLGDFGVGGTMPKPMIKLHYPDASITSVTGWPPNRSGDMTAIGAFGLTSGSEDAAAFLTLPGGKYMADIADANGGSGVVMLETYDASGAVANDAALINASTLGFVGVDDKAMFTGFVVKGAGSVKVLIRAVGPSLASFGIANPLSDPKIQIFQGSTKIAENDDWGTRTDGVSVATIQSAANAVSAFTIDPSSKDAVILRDFNEGTYSAQISGASGQTGTAIVELYVVP